jgi:hypothetical protein
MKRISVFAILILVTVCSLLAVLGFQTRSASNLHVVRSTGFSRNNAIPPKGGTTNDALKTNEHALRTPQDFQRGYRRWGGRRQRDPDDRGGVPLWKNDEADPGDVFTFVRIQWSQREEDSGRRRRPGFKWHTDYPDADLNLSYRLQQLTSIKTDPHGKILKLTDEELFKYPFIYIIEPGSLVFSDAEVVALRSYLERGGFLMVDDFWGEAEWANFALEMKRVFPDRPIEDIPLEHEIFNIVYKIKKKPLIPSVHAYQSGNWTERWDAREPHYRCIKDDSGRLMTVICHNTDLGDGWEQEGADSGYFEEYSEPYAYPLGINIVTYAMTH